MVHPVSKVFNGGSGGGGFSIGFGPGVRFGGGGGFSVGELLERTRPRNNAPPPKRTAALEPVTSIKNQRPPPAIRQAAPPAPKVQTVGILNDIVRNVIGGITGGGGDPRDINAQPQSGISNVLNDLILGATTSRQERAVLGTRRAGDIFKEVTRDILGAGAGRIGPGVEGVLSGLPVYGGNEAIFNLAAQNVARGTIGFSGGPAMPGPVVNLVPGRACPTGAQSFPAGTCLTDFEWEDAGRPRGFEIIGREGGNAILRKRGQRRRRRGLTDKQMTQVQWACDLPAACRKSVLHGIVHR